jgi:hypothetical protein
VQQLAQFCAVAMYIILCKTHVMFCEEEQEELGFHSCCTQVRRTVGPVLSPYLCILILSHIFHDFFVL